MAYKLNIEIVHYVKNYIQENWINLRRSHQDLLRASQDPKLPCDNNFQNIVYVPGNENLTEIKNNLQKAISREDYTKLTIRKLPLKFNAIKHHGLLYLPQPYIVPGGRFNEMYGWDSLFIVLGLLHNNQIQLAIHILENSIYQIKHYGKILNANRSYYLDRSQPPVFSQMVLAIYQYTKDKNWLIKSLDAIHKYYDFWTTPPHLISDINLSRYYAFSSAPAPEVIYSEVDEFGRTHYDRVKLYFQNHKVQTYNVAKFYDADNDELTPAYYLGDRSARESGFDPSSKFGPLGAATTSYTPVCLNSLLYKMEKDLAVIYRLLDDRAACQMWECKAKQRADLINHYCWDDDLGHYFDYHIRRKRTRAYISATTFYPLWAGIATKHQAHRVVLNLPALEAPGGILTSAYVTGNQWDAPYGWAPLYYFAIKGLERYGYKKPAKRLAHKFIKLVNYEFAKQGVIFEKYDISKNTSRVGLRFGYLTNEIGFGWTNAIYLLLVDYLQHEKNIFSELTE